MKAFLVILILTIFSPLQSDEITQDDLIGKWKIVNARITNPIYCGPWDPEPIIESTIEFTTEGLLLLTSKNGIEWANRTEPISWTFDDSKLTLRSDKTLKYQVSAITSIGNIYSRIFFLFF